jgi:hypothetical protein
MKVAAIIGGVVLVLLGGLVWLGSGPESGVKLANEMDKYALDYLDAHHVLQPAEKPIAYYDVTLKMDGSEAALVTDQRVVYMKDGRITAITLADVESVEQGKATLSDVYTVHSKKGESMRIEIATMNGGDTFYKELAAAWKRAAPRTNAR